MKSILTFLLVFGVCVVQAQINGSNDVENRALYQSHKVKSVKIYESRYKHNGKSGRREKLLFDNRYDSAGRMTEYFLFDGWMKDHSQYVYDSLGNVIEDVCFITKYDPYSTYYTYTYDAKNRMVERKEKGGEKWIFTYDEADRLIAQKWFYYGEQHEGAFFLDSFQYNTEKRLVKMTRYKSSHAIFFYKTIEYNAAGNKSKETRYENGMVTDVWSYFYDENGNLIREESYDGTTKETILSSFNAHYDSTGLLTSEVVQLSADQKKRYRKYVYEYY